MMGGGASLRQGGAQDSPPGGRERIPGVPRPPEALAPGGQKWLLREPRWFAWRQPPLVCVCVRFCVFACSCVRVSLSCVCCNFRPAPKVFFHFSLTICLPRAVLGVCSRGFAGGLVAVS